MPHQPTIVWLLTSLIRFVTNPEIRLKIEATQLKMAMAMAMHYRYATVGSKPGYAVLTVQL